MLIGTFRTDLQLWLPATLVTIRRPGVCDNLLVVSTFRTPTYYIHALRSTFLAHPFLPIDKAERSFDLARVKWGGGGGDPGEGFQINALQPSGFKIADVSIC